METQGENHVLPTGKQGKTNSNQGHHRQTSPFSRLVTTYPKVLIQPSKEHNILSRMHNVLSRMHNVLNREGNVIFRVYSVSISVRSTLQWSATAD